MVENMKVIWLKFIFWPHSWWLFLCFFRVSFNEVSWLKPYYYHSKPKELRSIYHMLLLHTYILFGNKVLTGRTYLNVKIYSLKVHKDIIFYRVPNTMVKWWYINWSLKSASPKYKADKNSINVNAQMLTVPALP